MTRKTAIIVCPGRGTYNAPELGYLKRYHGDKLDFLAMIDDVRKQNQQIPITTLDEAERFLARNQGRGDNASLLIYACAVADYMSINKDLYDVVGVTGNSMGWYLTLSIGGALTFENGARLVNTMGGIMTEHGVGGQLVYGLVDDDWRINPDKVKILDTVLETHPDLSMSIYLGGMAVIGGTESDIKQAMSKLPNAGHFPFQIKGHSAFHTPLLSHCVNHAQNSLKPTLFSSPKLPLIDGFGNIWSPQSTHIQALYDYTLGRQIDETYNFSKAIEVSAKEFAPDVFIVLGPGTTMGAPVAQTLISQSWQNIISKKTFQTRQTKNPIILSMGIEEQRALCV